jgi:hypothetical protein
MVQSADFDFDGRPRAAAIGPARIALHSEQNSGL